MSQDQRILPIIPDDDAEYWNTIDTLIEYYFIQPNSMEFPPIRYALGDGRTDGGDVNEANTIINYFISNFVDSSIGNLCNEAVEIYFKALYRCNPVNINIIQPLLEDIASSSSSGKVSLLHMIKCSYIPQADITYDKIVHYYYTDSKQENDDHTSCDICRINYEYEDYVQSLACNCDHTYHHSCINSWLKIRLACPYCSSDVIIPDVRVWKINNKQLYLSMKPLALLYLYNTLYFINDVTDEYAHMAEALITYNLLNQSEIGSNVTTWNF